MPLDQKFKVMSAGRQREHAVADPERAQALLDCCADDPALRKEMAGYHLISLSQLQPAHLAQIFRVAAKLEHSADRALTPLAGCILASAFLDDPNARAEQSFSNAFMRLGGNIMQFNDRLQAPEEDAAALRELASMCSNYADVAVLRTQYSESIYGMLDDMRIPIINAGNGLGEHPTQAMADLYTLFKWRPDLLKVEASTSDGLSIAILSTPARSRNVSSFLLALTLFPHAVKHIVVFGRAAEAFAPGQREMLERAGIQVETDLERYPNVGLIGGIEEALPDMDLIYADRTRRWGMSRQDMLHGMQGIKPGAMLLYPQLREQTIGDNLDHSEHNAYFAQERFAVFIRMAVFLCVLGVEI